MPTRPGEPLSQGPIKSWWQWIGWLPGLRREAAQGATKDLRVSWVSTKYLDARERPDSSAAQHESGRPSGLRQVTPLPRKMQIDFFYQVNSTALGNHGSDSAVTLVASARQNGGLTSLNRNLGAGGIRDGGLGSAVALPEFLQLFQGPLQVGLGFLVKRGP